MGRPPRVTEKWVSNQVRVRDRGERSILRSSQDCMKVHAINEMVSDLRSSINNGRFHTSLKFFVTSRGS